MRSGPWRLIGHAAACSAVLLAAVVVEGAWAWRLSWMGGTLDPVLLVVVALGLRRGPEVGAVAGFVGGLLQDLAGGGPLGGMAASRVVVGFGVGSLAATVVADSPLAASAFAALGTAAARGLDLGLSWLAGDPGQDPVLWLRAVLAAASGNALTAPLVFAGFRWAGRWGTRSRVPLRQGARSTG